MQDIFTIYIDRLSGGTVEKIEGVIPPDFLDIPDSHLRFEEDVQFKGEAYLADSHLIIRLDISTGYNTPCKICNKEVYFPLTLEKIYLTEDVEQIRSKVYDMTPAVRDAILLDIPMYSECEGNCPERAELEIYFKKSLSNHPSEELSTKE